jgi:ribosomal protein S18 acetylase RimI-like enzyme
MSPPTATGVAPTLRDARPSDRRAVRGVLLAAYREYAAALPPAVFGRYLHDLLDLDARGRAGRLLVAEHAHRIVGTATYYDDAAAEGLGWPPGWAGLRAVGVDPAARRLGVGRALVLACRERAEAAGAAVLCLHSAEFMTAAVALYEALGFRRDPTHDFDVAEHMGLDGVRPILAHAYRLDLPGPA